MSVSMDESPQASDDEEDEITVENDIMSLGIYLERSGFFKDKPWLHAYTTFLQILCIACQFCFEFVLYDEGTSKTFKKQILLSSNYNEV